MNRIPPYTPEADLAIRSELLSVEAEQLKEVAATAPGSWPSLNLKRGYIAPCGHTIAADPMVGIDYKVLLKERARCESLKSWAVIFGFASVALLVACLGLLHELGAK